jgi:hypothetical protein
LMLKWDEPAFEGRPVSMANDAQKWEFDF